MPLVYNKATRDRDFMETDMARANVINPVVGQYFSKFIVYNNLVPDDVKKTYPDSYKELSDPMKTCKFTVAVLGQEHKTVKYPLRDGNNPKDPWMMTNLTRQNYIVSLLKWGKKNYEEEPLNEMIRKNVPDKKVCSWAPDVF